MLQNRVEVPQKQNINFSVINQKQNLQYLQNNSKILWHFDFIVKQHFYWDIAYSTPLNLILPFEHFSIILIYLLF